MQLNGLGFDWGSLVDIGGKVYSTVKTSKAQTDAIRAQTAADIAARQEAARMTAMQAALPGAPGINLSTIAPLVLAAAAAAFFFLKKRRG